MISEPEAIEIVKKYLQGRNRDFLEINTSLVQFDKNERVIHGKSEGEFKDLFTVTYYIDGYDHKISYFVVLDAETGEVLFTMTPHGYAEEWEDM
ncbi:MAG: hypothetical protein HYZ16_02520 [Bacteroidetes bacterium]|nr:hypothetical protein [Bacteroidota bacterium]